MEQLTQGTFRSHLNTEFQIAYEGSAPVHVELIEVNDLGSTPRQDQFSILFRGPLDTRLPQRIYDFRHAQMDQFSLFIVPVRQDNDGFYYEAVFNRFIEENV